MQIEINDRKELPHLHREELTASITYEGPTPSRMDVQEEIAGEAKADPDLVVVRQIKPVFGSTRADVTARIYEDEESLKSIEGDYMQSRHSPGEETAEEETPEEPEEEAEGDEEPEEDEESAEEGEPEDEAGDEETEESDDEEKEAEG